MSGYGPFGFSFSLNFSNAIIRAKGRPGGNRGIVVGSVILLRLILGVITGITFELWGSWFLSQIEYRAYDFVAHKRGRGIAIMGSTGGLVIGLVLILLDFLTIRSRALGDLELASMPKQAPGRPPLPNIFSVRNQAGLRILLWPGLAAISGVCGSALYHLSINSTPGHRPKDRAATAAIVQAVGAALTVSAPSLVQMLLLVVSGNSLPK